MLALDPAVGQLHRRRGGCRAIIVGVVQIPMGMLNLVTTLVLTKRMASMTDRRYAIRTRPVDAAVVFMCWLMVAVMESRK